MSLEKSPQVQIGWQAVHFSLLGTDGNMHSLSRHKGKRGVVIAFICNHCPYVIENISHIVSAAGQLRAMDVSTIAIMSNDTDKYPQDSFPNMQKFAKQHKFDFPYLIDSQQRTAFAYQAVCTPDIFGFGRNLTLLYRGRVVGPGGQPELVNAMKTVADKNVAPSTQHSSQGCSIKWGADSQFVKQGYEF